jgi:hypothetical protein
MSRDDRGALVQCVRRADGRWPRLFLLIATMLGGACARPRAAVPMDAGAYQVGAVVRFTIDVDSHELYALRAPRRHAWSEALVVRGTPGYYQGATARLERAAATAPSAPAVSSTPSSDERPLVVVIFAEGGTHTSAYAVVVPVDSGVAGGRFDVGDAGAAVAPPRACIGDAWTAAFFLDGFGAPPTGPVILRIPTTDSAVHLRVDPAVHRVRAEPALQLRVGDPGVNARLAAARHVTLRVPGTYAVMPLVLRRGGRRWEAAVSLDRGTHVSAFFSGPGMHEERPSAPEEWRVVLLEGVGGCGVGG